MLDYEHVAANCIKIPVLPKCPYFGLISGAVSGKDMMQNYCSVFFASLDIDT